MLVAVATVATVGVGSRVIRKRLPIAIAKVGG